MRVVRAMAWRSMARNMRRPQTLMPMFLVPGMLLAVISASGASATGLQGFPSVDAFIDFVIAGTLLQATLLAGLMAGVALALDIESGFFDRLVTAPISRSSIVVARVIAAMGLAAMQSAVFLGFAVLFGVRPQGGVLGIGAVFLLTGLSGAAAAGATIAIALKSRSASTVQGLFPIVFVGLFLSSAFFPRHLLTGPAKAISDYNPLSYIVEAIREPVISDLSFDVFALGLGNAVGLTAVTVGLSVFTLKRRLGTD